MVYVVIAMTAMMGFASLAVDLGRYTVAHTQLYNAAMSASRAGALALGQTGSTAASVTTATTNVAMTNTVDGQAITSAMVTVQFFNWNGTTHTGTLESTANYSLANAVRVSISYSVPTLFAQALGLVKKTAIETSTAEVIILTESPYVAASGNPWLAGEPTGTKASQPDPSWPNAAHKYQYDLAGPVGLNTNGATATSSTYASYEPYASPLQVSFAVTPGSTITVSNTSGSSLIDYTNTWSDDATGERNNSPWFQDNASSHGSSEHGIADAQLPTGALVGVFLGSGLPDNISSPPTPLNFSSTGALNYTQLAPKIQQPYYIGNGQTIAGGQQEIVVPANATRFFLGIMDGWEWSNNSGGFNCTVTQTTVVTVQ